MNQTTQTIEEFLADFVDAFDSLDWDRFRLCFSDRASVYFPFANHSRIAKGRTELEEGFKGFFEELQVSGSGPPYLNLVPLDTHIEKLDGTVIVTFHLKFPDSLGRRTIVLGREGDKWKIVHLHASNTNG